MAMHKLNQNKIYILALILGILAFSIKLYIDKRPRIADISSIENLLKTEVVGSTRDTKDYLVASYALYKNFMPKIRYQEKDYFVCYRPTSSLVFAPLIFIFREYFPVFGILIFSILTYISSAYLLRSIGLSFIISAILLLFVFIFTFHYASRLLLEAPTFSLLAISLVLYIKGRILLSAIFLFFVSLIRPEFSIVGLLYLLKSRKLSLSFLLIPPVFAIILQNICGDQTNFYYWTYRSYARVSKENYNLSLEQFTEKIKSEVKNCILDKFGINVNQYIDPYRYDYMRITYPLSKYHSDCWKEMVRRNVKWQIDKVAKHFIENIFFLSIVPRTKRFNLLFPISIIFGTLTILGLIFYFKKDWFIPISYISIVTIYAMYNPLGFFDSARFKVYVLSFEILIIAQLYRDKIQNIQARILDIFSKKF